MTRFSKAAPYISLMAAAIMIAAAFSAFSPQTALTQSRSSIPAITIQADQASVYEGGLATFTLTRYGGHVTPLTVQVKTWEPDWDTPSPNPTEQTHDVSFTQGSRIATLRVAAYLDTRTDAANTTLKAQIQDATDSSYSVSGTGLATVLVMDYGTSPPLPVISIASDDASITEGDSAEFTLTRSSDTATQVTVDVLVEDPGGLLRGNLQDPPPQIPTQVDIAASQTTATLSLPVPDDLRDLPSDDLKVTVLPSHDYLLGEGTEMSDSIRVNDNDTRQELELNFGKDGTNDADVSESNADKLKIVVKRRQQDANAGNTATFTVRVETNRSGDDWRLEDWTQDTGTNRIYKDYPLELTGSDLQVEEELRVTFNGEPEGNWKYWASIRPIQDHAGDELTSTQEAQYWTVKSGFRETTVSATDSGASNGTITIESDVATVTEGESVVFTLYRVDGPMSSPVTVRVRTREPNRNPGSGTNPSTELRDVTIPAWKGHAEFTVYPYVDGVAETNTDQLIANIRSIYQVDGADRYTEGSPKRVTVEINDPPASGTIVTVAANPDSVVEGGSTTLTFTRAGGDTAQELTVNIRVDDPDERLRGNHWDAAPVIPTQVTIPANSTTGTMTLTFPDDQRDLELAGVVHVHVLPGTGYYLGQSGNTGTFTTLSVSDNDAAQVLTFKWGQIEENSPHWEAGESYLTCDAQDNCTPGPAEGTFRYEDGRDFQVRHRLQEPNPAHFLVSRRAQDTGKTATFVVRVEHNRDWESPRHTDWPTDPATGNRYQEFPLTLTGNQRQVVGRIEVLDNGLVDPSSWEYTAGIKQVEDASGTVLNATDEAQYWTVNGARESTIRPDLTLGIVVKIDSLMPKPVPEGDDVTITLKRQFGNPLEAYEVQVRTWEPNRSMADGTNPTDRTHEVTFPAVPMTDRFVQYVTQTETLTVATQDDSDYEPRDNFMAALSVYSAYSDRTLLLSTMKARILDDDRPTITLSVNDTSITEGDTATFTLTRGNNTANELIVGVSTDDPGGFLEGNYPSEAVAVPSSIMFQAGETTKQIAITPPDDWRDIPDNAITFTVAEEREYDIVGSRSLTVQVADNDVAPQVSISFNHREVEEGNDLVLTITRTGENKNPLEIPITSGPVNSQQYHVTGMDAGMSELRLTYSQPDDSFRGPDHHYRATLHPGRPEFWVPAGPTTANGSITDNDPYVVSVEANRNRVNEGDLLSYRIFHNGHSGEPLVVRVAHSETGNAVYDGNIGNHAHTIPAGSSTLTRAYLTHRNDGYDDDAEFTVELLADSAYEINTDRRDATITVRNQDPLPVLGFRDTSTTVSEGAGTVDIQVDMIAAVPPLKTVTVDYSVNNHYTGDAPNVTQSTGTLTFEPGETSAAITVEVLQNSTAGYKERFHVVLSNPVNAALQDGVASLIHDGVIEDDEPVVTLEAQAEAVDEGSDVILTLTRTNDKTDELTVWLQVTKTAPQALNRQDTVVFPAGDATAEHTITTTDDERRDGSHTVTAALLDPPAIGEPRTYWTGSPSSDTVTVREISLETVNLLTPQLRVEEGDSITLELTRSGASPLTVTLEVTETGDYTTGALPETVSFGLQERTTTVTIETQDDSTAENIGKLTVKLVDGTGYRAGWPNTHTFTIYDDDADKPSVSVAKDQNWVNEGQPVSFTFTRSTPTDNTLQARVELNRVRYRVTRADLDDPTRGITTPENHVHFDTEEITVDFPAGTRTVTVTRLTSDDSLNYGNSTYHATVLNDADDDYVAFYNASAFTWVQDDDIPTVTGAQGTSESNPVDQEHETILPFTRTGDNSGRLLLADDITSVIHWPAPLQDDEITRTRTVGTGSGFSPGDSTGVSIGTLGLPMALGRSGTLELQPHHCPNNPSACGYYPQYRVGTPSSITFRYYSSFMGVRIKKDQSQVSEGDPATFTLYRHGGKADSLTRPLTVKILVTPEGDYITGAAPQTVVIPSGDSSATLSIPTSDDTVDELDGAITVEIQYTGVLEKADSCPSQDDSYCYRLKEYPGSPWYVRSVTTRVNDDDYILPDVSVSDAQADETDGTMEFTVSLSQANNERAATVDWATREDGSTNAATSNTDFTAANGTLNFAVGETEKTITVTLLDDQLDEADETFNVVLSNPSELTLADHIGTGTILDDDLDYGIAFSQSTFHTEEGDNVLVSLQRLVSQESGGGICYATIQGICFSPAQPGNPANTEITVNLGVTQQGNYLSGTLPATVTFNQGAAEVELSLPTTDDSTVEADGSLRIEILQGAGYSPVYIGPPDSQDQGKPHRTLYLYDNDLEFSVNDVQASEDAGQMDFTVSLNEPAPQQVTVDAATMDGEATSHANVTPASLGRDFEARNGTLTFALGEQTKTFSVVTSDDTIHERDETFTVHLSTPSQSRNRYNSARRWSTLTSLADDAATGTIMDDEEPMIASVSRSYSTVNEDHPGPVQFMVDLSHHATTNHERNPAVAWEITAGTATAGEDYQDAADRLTFPIGTTRGFIPVEIIDDNLFEEALETFTVQLTDQGTRLASISPTNASYQASIRDDETLTAAITANAENVSEGEAAVFTVTLTGGVPQKAVSVQFETSGTASAQDDYGAPSGMVSSSLNGSSGYTGTLEIPAGQTHGAITFPILTDSVADDGETLEVEIFYVSSGSRAASVSAEQFSAESNLLDLGALTVSIRGSPSPDEGDSATFTVYMTKTSTEPVSVDWQTRQAGDTLSPDETAEPGKDYTAETGTVSIPPGNTSGTFTVSTTDDTLAEGNETFRVTLEEARNGTATPVEMLPLGVTVAMGTIQDDDSAPTGLTISSVSPGQVNESAGATDITMTVGLDGTTQLTTDTPVTVEMIDRPGVSNNATLEVDYTATTANVTIPAGQSSVAATITLTPVDDSLSEGTEVARISVKSTAFAGSAGKGVRILDDDVEPGIVTLTVTPDTVAETASSVQLTVTGTLMGLSSRLIDTVVSLQLADGTATRGEDYQAATGTLTIPAGEMSATAVMTLTVLDDDTVEGDEKLNVTGTVPGTITATAAEVVIQDDDHEPTSIFLSVTTGPIGEGGGALTVPVTATLLGGGTRNTSTLVTLRIADLTATVNDDYTAAWNSQTLTIPAGEFSATASLTLTPVDDTLHEGNEHMAVRGTNSDPGLPVNGVRLTILDNDDQPDTIALSLSNNTLSEGGGPHTPTLTATLQGGSTLTTSVNITVSISGDTQRSQSYLANLLGPLQIPAGQSQGTEFLIIGGLDDDVDDMDEGVEIRGEADNPDLTVTPAQLTITNDDTSGVRVNPTALTVREGQRKNYTISLTSEPTGNVVLTVDAPANAGFTVNPGTVTFTPQSWGRKYIFVTGIEDQDADDEPPQDISHSLSSSVDAKYDGASSPNVRVTVRDTVSAAVQITPTELNIDEGGSDSYTVALDTQPSGDVTVTIGGATGTALSLSDSSLTFTTSNWNVAQTVTVTAGQDDNADEEEITLTNTVSGGGYDGITADSVVVTVTDDDTRGITVSPTAITVIGGRSNQYTVVLDTEPMGDVTVTVGGATGTDLTLDQTTLTFTDQNWDTAQAVTVSASQTASAGTETLTHTVSSTDDANYDALAAESVAVTVIQAPGNPIVQVGVLASDHELTVPEGESRTYSIVLASQPEGDVTVAIAGTTGTDLTLSDSSLTFTTTNWNTPQEVTVTAAQDDDAVDDIATLTHTAISAADSDYDGAAVESVLVTITDDETAGVTVSETSLEIVEGNSDTYTVVLDTEPQGNVVIAIGGTTGTDLILSNSSLTFTSGNWNTPQTVTVTALQDADAVDEAAVNITHTVTSADDADYDGMTAGSVAVTVTDDDDVQVNVSFGAASYAVAEGDSVTVTVTLDADPERMVTIPLLRVNQGGATASDYNVPNSVVFNSGDTEKTFSFSATQDTDNDDGESVRVSFGNLPTGVNAGTTDGTTISITDDDVPSVTASFGQGSYTVAEGSSTPVKVVLSADPERTVTIPLTKDNQGGATPSDYNIPSNIVLNSGDTEKTFSFMATDDSDNDDGESVKLGFGTLPTGVTTSTTDETTVSITDDDVPPVIVSFEQSSYTVAEGNSVTVKMKLDADPERTVTIPLTKNNQGGATASDYSIPNSVVFNSGDTEQNFNFAAESDSDNDDGESVKLGFGTLPAGVSAGVTNETTISITDDDVPNVTVSFEQSSYTVQEGDSSNIKVVLSADPERVVVVPVTATNLDGASNDDYSVVPASVTFNAGETEQTFSFMATDDNDNDDGESVKLDFMNLPDQVSAGAINTTTISITDDDVPQVNVSFEQDSYTVAEGNSVNIKVKLNAEPERTVTIPLNKTNQGGASSSDYSGVPASAVFNSGDTEKTFNFMATDDTANDDGESVKLGFGNLPAGVSAGTTNETTVSVTDDDAPSVTVSFGAASYAVAEGSSTTITVKLSADPERTVEVPITAADLGGASTTDYSGVPTNVVFISGDTEKTFTFAATDDTVDDDGESVELGFGNPPAGVSTGMPSETTVSITDDDVPSITVSFGASSYTVAEGSSVNVKVTLSADPERDVEVPITQTPLDGATRDDYSGVPASVTFNSGDTEETFSFSATQDTENDDGEEVMLTFGTLPARVSSTGPSQAVVSITDDDVPAVTVNFEQASYTVAEGSAVTIKVTLDANPEQTVTVPLTKANKGGATSSDYSGIPANVVFTSGDTEQTFSFAATQDTDNDDNESVKLGFGSLQSGVSAGTTNETTISITDDDVPTVAVSFEQASYTVVEGSSVTIKVKLDANPERTVTVPITKNNQGGATASDYSGVPANVVFNSGDTEQTFSFAAADDTVDDDDESIKLGFGNLPTGVNAGTTDETTVSIIDDDLPSVTVSFEQASYTVAEGSSVMVKATLSADPERTVTVQITKTNQGGASNSDYSGVPANLAFNSGNTEQTFTFTAAPDSDNDDGETVQLGFMNLPDQVSAGAISTTTISITDDDVPQVNVSFEQASYTVAEGNSATIKVKLDADPERTVTVPITKANQGGASNSDYSAPNSVVFNSGDTEKTFSFMATDDTANDDGESVKLGFTNLPAGVSAGATNETTVSITDDDAPSVTVSFGAASYAVAEGSSTTITVKLSADPERTVEVPITDVAIGGATGDDYSGIPANLAFNTGDTEKTFSFSATQDTENDDGEGVRLTFGTLPDGVSSTSPSQPVVSITDDDVPSVTVSFEQNSYTAPEGSSTTVKVKLDANPERTVTIPITSTNQGGASNDDYSGVPANVVFNSGDTEKTFNFSAADDNLDDDDESVKLGFGNLPTGVTAGSPDETVVSITDQDVPQVTASFDHSSYSVDEGNSVTVKVTLNADPERTVTIPLTSTNQGGASNSDYSGVPTNVVFNSGDTEKTFSFAATQDSADDDGESVKLDFGSLPTGVSAGATSETTVSITDDDAPSVTVSFGAASYNVAEGDSVTVKITLSADPERTVTIPLLKVNQDGASSSDYSGVPASLVFISGETEQTFDFAATDDSQDDDGESVRVSMGTLPDQVSAGANTGATITITDDDAPSVAVSFEQASYTVAEGGSVTVKVVLSADPERTVTVPITKTNQGGASNGDYSGVPANVVFSSGDTEKTFSFAATQDSVDDDGESIKLGFGSLPTGVSQGTHAEATVSITDDDVPSVTASFEQSSYTVAEGSSVTVKVVLNTDPERTVTIPLTKSNQGGASSSDYSGVPASLVFNSGDTEKTFSFSAADDTVDDDGESVKLGFGSLPADVAAGATSETTISITDDDIPPVTVSFGAASYSVAEGNSVTVKVKLSAVPERPVEVPITAMDLGGAVPADYSGVPASVTFDSSDTEKTFSFIAADDVDNDDGKSVRLTFGTLPARVTSTSPSQAVVSITDDDVPSVAVSFEQSSYTVTEGNAVTIRVKLDTDPERTATIPITKTNQGGATDSDYSGVPVNVMFNSGDTEKTFSFTAESDTDNDDGESVKLTFGTLPAAVTEGTTNETIVSITDDDVPSVTVSFEQASYTVAEGGSVTIKVKLDADPERMVTIPLTKSNQDGASASDYSGVPGNVVFNSGDTEKTFSFNAAQDTIDDDGESIRLGFDTLPAGVSTGTPNRAVVSITDDDVPPITVSYGQASYTVVEGSSVNVKVVLSADPERDVEIPITATNLDGASNSDYSGVPATITFNSGDTEKTFRFMATDDSQDDDGEGVKLTFGTLPARVSSTGPSQAVVSITDDDVTAVTVNFEATAYSVDEGDSVTITLTLDADPQRTITIPLTRNNQGGASNSDYSGVPANIIFNSGDTEKTFDFAAAQDNADDDGESVKLGFGTMQTGVSAGVTDETTISITDDDVPNVTVRFEQASYTAAEGGSVTVKVKLSADPERTVTIPLTKMNQGGASASDYSGIPANVVFNTGDTEKTFNFSAAQDTVDDDGESVKLGFGNLPARVTAGVNSSATISITDDDVPSVTVSFGSDEYSVMEGEGVTVTVTLSADPERTVTIPITRTNQDDATDDDYTGVPATVVFNSGETGKTFDFAATDDEENDDDEKVKLNFGTLPAAVSTGAITETVVSIIDTDGGQQGFNKGIPVGVFITISFEQAAYDAREGGDTTIKVQLSDDPQGTVSVPLTTTDGTGLTASDYSGVPATLDFIPGDTEKSFILTAVQDQADESDETLTLGFGALPAGMSNGDTTQAQVTIADSLRVSFGASSYQAYEGGVGAQVIVKLDEPAPVGTVIPITAAGMNGATSTDWTGVPHTLTFASGDTQKTFTLMAYDDDVEDGGESVDLEFGTLPSGVVRGTPSTATVELMNTETPTCETAVWCADVEFANSASRDWGRMGLGLGYHHTQEPYLRYSSLSDNRFTFRGREYQVWSMFTFPGVHPDVGPGSPGRIPEYSTFSMHIMEVVDGELKNSVRQAHRRDWTLHIDGISLPFTGVVSTNGSGSGFTWQHPELQDLYADWTDGTTYEIIIAEDPVDDRPEPPQTTPIAPKYLRVIPGDGNLTAVLKKSMDDGNSDITHYRLQWKLATGSWGNPNDVQEADVQPPSGRLTQVFHFLSGLSNYTLYDLRVIAVNGVGDSEPSEEHFGTPQDEQLDITDTVVDGNQLTITYGSTLDPASVPSEESFRVLVNGGPRKITGVAISGQSVVLTLDEPAKRAIRASDMVEFRYVMPPSGTPAIRDTEGNYAHSSHFDEPDAEARNETDPGLLEPVTAEFKMKPSSHSGPGNEVIFRIEFSEPVRVDMGRVFAHLLEVEGGNTTSAWWLDGDATIWEIVVEPEDDHDIKIKLIKNRACGEQGAPCGSGKRRLSNQPEITISGGDGPRNTRSANPNDGGRKGKSDQPEPGGSDEKERSDEQPNRAAGGKLLIAGEARVGQTLTADTSGVSDPDGLEDAEFAYQWTAGGQNIQDATEATYTLTAEEEDLEVRVFVSFQDDAGNPESLMSQPTAAVEPEHTNTPATGQPVIQGEARVGQTLTADTSGIQDEDGMQDASFTYRWVAGGDNIQEAAQSSYTLTGDEEDLTISVRVSFTDDAGNPETRTSDGTEAVLPEHTNTPATGQPVIRGEARVGQTLTADTSGIQDEDGMQDASFTYRWVAGGMDIQGATGQTYTLTSDELDLTITVWVSFTDDMGTAEALVSQATGAVVPENPPPAPENLAATLNDDGTITLTWDAPQDDTITGYRILRRLPQEGEEEFQVIAQDTGTTVANYTDTGVTPGTRHNYRVQALNANGPSERSRPVRITPQ